VDQKNIDIQQELNRLEEIVLASPRIPLTRRTLVDEEQLLDHLDLVRLHLPVAFQEASSHYPTKRKSQAEQHAEKIIQVAEARAAQILNEMDIIQLAELEANRSSKKRNKSVKLLRSRPGLKLSRCTVRLNKSCRRCMHALSLKRFKRS